MAVGTFSTSDYLERTISVAHPITLSAWVYLSSGTGGDVYAFGAFTSGIHVAIGVDISSNAFATTASSETDRRTAVSSSGLSTGVWANIIGTFASSSNRTVYLNGGSSSTQSSNRTIGTYTLAGVGVRDTSTKANALSMGYVAEAAIWSVVLSAGEIASIADGYSPLSIRPQSRVFFSPLVREFIDLDGGPLTPVGTPGVFPHPRVYN